MQRADIEVDENLPNFWTAVKFSQAQEVVKEFNNMKDGYLMEIEDPRVIEVLSDITKMPKRAIQRTPWYNILSNQTYSEAFYYIGAHIGEREKLIKDVDDNDDNNCEQSDMVNLLLNLGNIPDEVAKKFNFTPGFQPEFKKAMQEYRVKFEREHGVKWSYMTADVIDRYLEFKERQDFKYFRQSVSFAKTSAKTVELSLISERQKLLMTKDSQGGHNDDIQQVLAEKRSAPKLM